MEAKLHIFDGNGLKQYRLVHESPAGYSTETGCTIYHLIREHYERSKGKRDGCAGWKYGRSQLKRRNRAIGAACPAHHHGKDERRVRFAYRDNTDNE